MLENGASLVVYFLKYVKQPDSYLEQFKEFLNTIEQSYEENKMPLDIEDICYTLQQCWIEKCLEIRKNGLEVSIQTKSSDYENNNITTEDDKHGRL